MFYVDEIFINGIIYTLDPANPRAEALAVNRGEILLAGRREDCEALKGPQTRVTDLEGQAILPGFNDAHCHLLSLRGQQLLQIDCSPEKVSTIEDILEIIRREAAGTPKGAWILAGGVDAMKVREKRVPTRWELDKAAPDHPVHLRSQTCHYGVVNSLGFKKGGITRDTPDPPGGEFDRDAQGELTGICREEAHFLFVSGMGNADSFVPSYTDEDYLKALKLGCREYNSYGITSVGDALSGPPELRAYQRAYQEGALTVRAYLNMLDIHLPLIKELGLATGFGDEWVKVGAIKSFVDGAVAGHTAWLSEAYGNRPDYYGIPTKTPEDTNALVEAAHRAYLQMEIHANGDRAIDMVLDAYEKAQKDFPRPDPRHRIAHCTVINDRILNRIKALGVVVLPFASYVYEHGDKMAPYGDRIERMFAHRSFLDKGIPTAGSTDHPCGSQNPYRALQGMVTRRDKEGREVGLSQRVSLEEALRIYTSGSAYATFEENRKGQLKRGMLADFIALSQDPFKTESERLGELKTLKTWVGGRLVYSA